MGKTKKTSTEVARKTKRAETPEARENQMIALAVDLAEKQLTKELLPLKSSPII